MRELALDFGFVGTLLIFAPLPIYLVLMAWAFYLRFCQLSWSPACQRVVEMRTYGAGTVFITGLNLLVMEKVAASNMGEWVLYALLVWTIFVVFVTGRRWLQIRREFRELMDDRQLKLPLGLPCEE